MNFDDLIKLKKPLLTIHKSMITDQNILKELIFPGELLYPIGVCSNEEATDKNEQQKERNQQLQQLLDTQSLTFNEYKPTPKDIIEGYGAKYLDVTYSYKGFGFYEIISKSGFKKRNDEKDRRYLIEDKTAPSNKEEFYLFFDDRPDEETPDKTPGFRRIAKKTFFDMLEQYQSIKYTPDIRDLINRYKLFFNGYFLPNVNFYAKFKIKQMESFDSYGQYEQLIQDMQPNLETMKHFYLFQNITGELSETSFANITNQIEQLRAILTDMTVFINNVPDKQLKIDEVPEHKGFLSVLNTFNRHMKVMRTPLYTINIQTGEFHENLMSFYKKFATTERHDNDEMEALKKQVTLLNILFRIYNFENNHTTLEEFHEKKKVLHEQELDTSKDYLKTIDERKNFLKACMLNYKIRTKFDPGILHFLYLFNDMERDDILNSIKELEKKVDHLKGS